MIHVITACNRLFFFIIIRFLLATYHHHTMQYRNIKVQLKWLESSFYTRQIHASVKKTLANVNKRWKKPIYQIKKKKWWIFDVCMQFLLNVFTQQLVLFNQALFVRNFLHEMHVCEISDLLRDKSLLLYLFHWSGWSVLAMTNCLKCLTYEIQVRIIYTCRNGHRHYLIIFCPGSHCEIDVYQQHWLLPIKFGCM